MSAGTEPAGSLPRIAVYGAGAVGAHLGGLLSAAGLDVTLIGRPAVLDPMEGSGVTIRRSDGSAVWANPRLAPVARDSTLQLSCPDVGKFDLVLLTVKAFSVQSSLDDVEVLLGVAGTVAAFQNGVGSDSFLTDRFGPDRVIAATSTVSVGMDQPAEVIEYTRGGGLAWVAYGKTPDIGETLGRTGLPCFVAPSPASLRWSKLLLNAVGSAQCAILGTTMKQIVADSRLFRAEQLAFRERLSVMSAAQIPAVDLPGYRVRLASSVMKLPPWLPRPLLGPRIARGRGGKQPTLAADVAKGGPTENQYLNGATVELGRKTAVPVPVNAALHALVERVTVSAEERARFHDSPDRLMEALQAAGVRL